MGGSQMATDSSVYARVERLYSPLWLTTVFSPQVDAEFEALGLHPLERYFEHPEGRPLFAGYAALPWPEDRHLQLWHAHYLLREFRGDGHIWILASEGLSGLEALLLHIAWTPALGPLFRATRGWTDDEWDAATDERRGAGWLSGDEQLTLTPAGRAYRERIEARTNDRNAPAYRSATRDDLAKLTTTGARIR